MKKIRLRFESGRSMVEIIGVLVAVGVITMVGVGLTRFGLDYVHANAIMSGAEERLIPLSRRKATRSNEDAQTVLNGFPSTIMDYYPVELETHEGESPVLKVSSISRGVCRILQQRKDTPMTINGVERETATCLEENNVVRFGLLADMRRDCQQRVCSQGACITRTIRVPIQQVGYLSDG